MKIIRKSMGNEERNRQFNNVCKRLRIVDKSIQRRFHEYLNSAEYEGISDDFSYEELLKVGEEFLECAGLKKKRK